MAYRPPPSCLSPIRFLLSAADCFALIRLSADNLIFLFIHIEQDIQLIKSGSFCPQFFLLCKRLFDFLLRCFKLLLRIFKAVFRISKYFLKAFYAVIYSHDITVSIIAKRYISACFAF